MSHIVDYDEEPGSRWTRRPRPDEERRLHDRSYDADRRPSHDNRSYDTEERPRPHDRSYDTEGRPRPHDRSYDTEGRPRPHDRSYDVDRRPPHDRSYDVDRRPPHDRSYDADRRPPHDRSYDADRRPLHDRSYDADRRPPPGSRQTDPRPSPRSDERRPSDRSQPTESYDQTPRQPSMRVYDDEPRSLRLSSFDSEPRGGGPSRGDNRPPTGARLEEGAPMRPPTARLEDGATMQPPKTRLETGPSSKPPSGVRIHSSTFRPDTSISQPDSGKRNTVKKIQRPVKGPSDSDTDSPTASAVSTDMAPPSGHFRTSSDFDRLDDRSRDSRDSNEGGHVNGSFDGTYERPDRLRDRPDRPQFVREVEHGGPRSSYERAREDAYLERIHDKQRHEQQRRHSYDQSEGSDDGDSIDIYHHRWFLAMAVVQMFLGIVVAAFGVVLTQLPAWSRHYGVAIILGIILGITGGTGLLTCQVRQMGMLKFYKYMNYFGILMSLFLLAFYLTDVTFSHGKFYDGYYPYILTPDGPMLHWRYIQAQVMLSSIILLIIIGPVHFFICIYQVYVCRKTQKKYERPAPRVYDASRAPRDDPVLHREQERVAYISTQSLV